MKLARIRLLPLRRHAQAFLGALLFTLPAIAQNSLPPPQPNDFPDELAAIRGTLLHFLSPLHPEYSQENKVAQIKRQVDETTAAEIDKVVGRKKYRCYLKKQELQNYLFPSKPEKPEKFSKVFGFMNDCDVDGTVEMTSGQIFRVDLNTKGYGEIFRIRFLMKLSAERNKYERIDAKIYDGEIYLAKNKYEPHLIFFADYTLVLDPNGNLIDNTGGSVYIKSAERKKVDRIFQLKIE